MPEASLNLQGFHFTHLKPLQGGRNNKVFRADGALGDVIIKSYFYNKSDVRDRLTSEFSMLSFLRENNLFTVPEPLLSDIDTHTGVYRFIYGTPVTSDDISEKDVIALATLLSDMWSVREAPKAQLLPQASEACFSIHEYCLKVENRFELFKQLQTQNPVVKDALTFIFDKLYPLFCDISRNAQTDDKIFTRILDHSLRTLSPSDHGFHNAIRSADGTLSFIDFEYSGWDDPAKMISDAFLQPDKPIPVNLRSLFLKHINQIISPLDDFLKRITHIYPILGIKWCLIMLNEFLPLSELRRKFAGETTDNELKKNQIDRSMTLYNRIKEDFEQSYIISLIKNSL